MTDGGYTPAIQAILLDAGFRPSSRVRLFGTGGDTDPDLNQSLIRARAAAVRARAAAWSPT